MSLVKKISLMTIGNVIYSACQWGILIVLAKYSNPALVGQYSLALAITTPLYALSNFQLRGLISTDVSDEYSVDVYFSLRILMSFFVVIIISIYCFVFFENSGVRYVILLVGLAKAIESGSDIVYGYLQKYGLVNSIVKSLVIRGFFGLLSYCVGIVFFNSVVISSVFLCFLWLFVLIFFDLNLVKISFFLFRKYVLSCNYANMWRLFVVAFPMGFVLCLNSFAMNIPRYLLAYNLGENELGYYTAIFNFVLIGSTIITATCQVVSPSLARNYIENKFKFVILVTKLFLVVLFLGICAIFASVFFGKNILIFFYTEKYGDYSHLFTLTMLCGSVLYCVSVLGSAVTAARSFRPQAWMSLISLVVVGVASYILIPNYKIEGGIWALIIGYSSYLICLLVLLVSLLVRDKYFLGGCGENP